LRDRGPQAAMCELEIICFLQTGVSECWISASK